MPEKINKTELKRNIKRLEQQCENEDLAKYILYCSKDKEKPEQNERRKFLKKRLEERKNLYIYPEQVNA